MNSKHENAIHRPSLRSQGCGFPSQAPRLRNDDLLTWRPVGSTDTLDRLDEFLPLDHFAKDGVLTVEMRGGDGGDEELRSIAVQVVSSGCRGGMLRKR